MATIDIAEPAMRFLAVNGWGAARVRPLAGDASFRRYFRVDDGDRKAVLMDAPSPHENAGAFAALDTYLAGKGISVPEIYAADTDAGYLLLEDLGDAMFVAAMANGADEAELYATATDVLAHLHRDPMVIQCDQHPINSYAIARMRAEVGLLLDWHWPEIKGKLASDDERAGYEAAWDAVWSIATRYDDRLVQLDYHSPNLMWLAEREGLRRVGVLDFQDAMRGPAAYDLVSLLQDPRRDVRAGLEPQLVNRYLAQRSEFDREVFLASYAVMGAQRAARILGVFIRLWRRDGKTAYLKHIPRVWRLLDENLANPALAPVAAWFRRHLPTDQRRDFSDII